MKTKKWYDYMWIWLIVYFTLGFFNIFFAWLGLFDFLTPLIIASIGKGKWSCNHLCARGQFYAVLGNAIKGKKNVKAAPKWLSSKGFRYGFLAFFLTMFGTMMYQTVMVFAGKTELKQIVKLFWTFRLPWHWAYTPGIFPTWMAQFGFGFYSIMLTSTLIGLILMFIYRPRTWCSFCPMGTMTQSICMLKEQDSSTRL